MILFPWDTYICNLTAAAMYLTFLSQFNLNYGYSFIRIPSDRRFNKRFDREGKNHVVF